MIDSWLNRNSKLLIWGLIFLCIGLIVLIFFKPVGTLNEKELKSLQESVSNIQVKVDKTYAIVEEQNQRAKQLEIELTTLRQNNVEGYDEIKSKYDYTSFSKDGNDYTHSDIYN